jgi:hypothetical protein
VGHQGVVDKALELDLSLKSVLEQQREELENNGIDILSGDSTGEQESGKAESEDTQAVF